MSCLPPGTMYFLSALSGIRERGLYFQRPVVDFAWESHLGLQTLARGGEAVLTIPVQGWS